ncbi:hypothetical protein [Sinorhizobium psoraleae]|uniref:Uncharacterized protein n=1 Tax=Sinorhizobium psoraleae TaxID=520838 RepID=A0ABT4KM67_9HYPH|nr:hypothetical protein [Sinorhizobium psoraleae]MCZ4092007.1 hypothetical protein [Sinorhizobium psoraleae]
MHRKLLKSQLFEQSCDLAGLFAPYSVALDHAAALCSLAEKSQASDMSHVPHAIKAESQILQKNCKEYYGTLARRAWASRFEAKAALLDSNK